MHLTHRERRPVAMYYVAAGALERGANAVALVERLKLQCGEADKDWLEGLGSNIPIELLGGDTPPKWRFRQFKRSERPEIAPSAQ